MCMELAVFQELTEEITLECFYMTDSQQEEKIIQLIDLHHFVECYHDPIRILDYIHHPINIIENEDIRKGILFYDVRHSQPIDWNAFEEFKRRNQLKELWFVFVEEDVVTDPARYTDFIIENSTDLLYDRIFRFNFFQSAIQQLK